MKPSTISRRSTPLVLCIGAFAAVAAYPAMAADKNRLDNQLDELSAPCEVLLYQEHLDLENAKMAGTLNADMAMHVFDPAATCFKSAREKGAAVYQSFVALAEKKPALKEAGKEVYAAWRAQLFKERGSPERTLYEQASSRLDVEYETP